MDKIRIFHIVQCAGGVDCYLRMLLTSMDRNRFEHILICSFDYSKDEYKNLVDEFVQIEMRNSLSLMTDVKAISSVRNFIKYYRPDIIYCYSLLSE